MIVGIVGVLGSGKTLTLTWFGAYHHYILKRKIAANYWVSYPHEKIVSPLDLESFRNTTILLDEAWIWLDSYATRSAIEETLIQIILNSRRRGNHLFYTAQHKYMIHARLRRVTDYYILPIIHKNEHVMELWAYNPATSTQTFLRWVDCKPVYKMYNTKEELGYLRTAKQKAEEHLRKVKKEEVRRWGLKAFSLEEQG